MQASRWPGHLYAVLVGSNLLGAAIVLYFVLKEVRFGLSFDDLAFVLIGSSSVAAVIAGAHWLRRRRRLIAANVLLFASAVPIGLFAALLVMLELNPIAFR